MGDSVEQILERQLPALRDLVDRRLMSSDEVKGIIEQRRQFEYRLQRRAARKVDFIRYVEFELKVDSLRKLRKKRLSLKKKTISDFAHISHIFFIFERAVRKFQADPDMWQQLIDFAIRQNAEKRLSVLFPRALQMHPRNASLWIRAASWQYFTLSNATTARVLLQRALRMNPQEKQIWTEYFRVEMHYVAKINARRGVLGIDEVDDSARFAVPITLFRTATNQHRNDLDFRVNFIKICEEFDNAGFMENVILESIETEFAMKPEAWLFMATHHWPQESTCFEYLEQGVLAIPDSVEMWESYINFLIKCQYSNPESSNRYVAIIDEVCTRANQAGCLSPSAYRKWSQLVVEDSCPEREESIIRKGISTHPRSSELWVALMQASKWSMGVTQMKELLDQSLQSIGKDMSQETLCELYQPFLDHCISQASYQDSECSGSFLDALNRFALPPSPICVQYLNWTFATKGLSATRMAHAKLREIYRGSNKHMRDISTEYAKLLLSSTDVDILEVRQVYDSAISTAEDGSAQHAFESYINFELSLGHIDKVSSLRWRLSALSE